jgi:hypothetical protein
MKKEEGRMKKPPFAGGVQIGRGARIVSNPQRVDSAIPLRVEPTRAPLAILKFKSGNCPFATRLAIRHPSFYILPLKSYV